MYDERLIITSARIDGPDGTPACLIERIGVGGGTRTRMVDGTPEDTTDPVSVVYHVRFISPSRMIADELREAADLDAAVELGCRYVDRVAANTQQLADIAADLKNVT